MKAYFQDDVTALQWDSMTGMMNELGSGTMSGEAQEVENGAINDEYVDGRTTKKRYTFTGELACESGGASWFVKLGEEGTMTFQSSTGNISGTFFCATAEQKQEDALRWNVTLKSRGTVTVS